ncbi:MAG: hypothetical protein H0V82_02025 [Candidatus Protochlamydia sp.]|nr:hypothetical protein [Candidatus Protochlamydia sp.]
MLINSNSTFDNNRMMIELIDRFGSYESIPTQLFPSCKLVCQETFSNFDPTGRLADMSGKVKLIQGNANLETAQVILLADHCHLDEDHKLWRGQIGMRVKSLFNIILCEGIDSDRLGFSLSSQEKKHALGEGFKLGYNDYVTGWDNGYLYKKSLGKIKNSFTSLDTNQLKALTSLQEITPENHSELLITVKKIQSIEKSHSKIMEMSEDRTDNLVECLEQKLATADGARIIVDGGAGHLLDQRLLNRLDKQGIKFCAISTELGIKGKQIISSDSADKLTALKEYYGNK